MGIATIVICDRCKVQEITENPDSLSYNHVDSMFPRRWWYLCSDCKQKLWEIKNNVRDYEYRKQKEFYDV